VGKSPKNKGGKVFVDDKGDNLYNDDFGTKNGVYVRPDIEIHAVYVYAKDIELGGAQDRNA